jgi:SAM-dependent methyltransferase
MPSPLTFACPRCRGPLQPTAPDALFCAADDLCFQRSGGIWRFLPPERGAVFEQFIQDYETIRRGEGRGSQDTSYYRALPYRDLSGRMTTDWGIRAASYDALIKRVIRPAGRPLSILDLGAGNGWLSNRLAGLGHRLAAVDLLINDFDGLGCHPYYEAAFTPVQAEFDRLPFPDGRLDLVVFNASLHYSVAIRETLREALRVLAQGGKVIVMDSPVYRDPASGEEMVRERERAFMRRFGFPSNALPSQNFLTYSGLQDLETSLDIHWQIITPFYGLGWLLKPLKARLLANREAAKFHLIVGLKKQN